MVFCIVIMQWSMIVWRFRSFGADGALRAVPIGRFLFGLHWFIEPWGKPTVSRKINKKQQWNKNKCFGSLGLYTQSGLRAHIDYVYNKLPVLIKYVDIFYKLQYNVPSKCLRNIYYAFVYITYYMVLNSYLDKLVKLNNKLLRILHGKSRRSTVLDLYENYNTLPLPQLHQFSVLVFVHKFIHHTDILPDIFHNYFTLNSSAHNYATRQKDGRHLFNINTTHGQRSVRHNGVYIMEWSPSHTAT